MAPIIRAFVLVLLLAAPSLAQVTTPAWDFYAGYSIRRTDAREFFRSSAILYAFRDRMMNLEGFNVAITENRNHWFGGTIDFSFHEKRTVAAGVTPQLAAAPNRQKTWSLMYGPRFSVRRIRWVTPFVHVLLGAAHMDRSVTPTGPRASDTSFAVAAGGGVDVKVWKKISVRPVQADYFRTEALGLRPNGYRASAGIVFQLGQR